MYFYHMSVRKTRPNYVNITHCAHLDSMFVKGGPFDDVGLEGVVNLGYQLEGQGLWRSVRVRADRVGENSYL